MLQVRRARLLEDKEDELLHRVEIETNLKVVKEVSVHAAVNDDGEQKWLKLFENLFIIFIEDKLEMKLQWENVDLSKYLGEDVEQAEESTQTVNMRNKKVNKNVIYCDKKTIQITLLESERLHFIDPNAKEYHAKRRTLLVF